MVPALRGGSALTYRAKQRNFTAEVAIREYYPEGIAVRDAGTGEVRPVDPAGENPVPAGGKSSVEPQGHS